MLTFPGPFTVCINFIEAVVGLEGIHEKNSKGIEEQKQWLLPISAFLSQQRLWPPCCEREPRSRRSHPRGRVLLHVTQPCALDQAALCARPIGGFCRDKECFIAIVSSTRSGLH